jgi:hypothetical protein
VLAATGGRTLHQAIFGEGVVVHGLLHKGNDLVGEGVRHGIGLQSSVATMAATSRVGGFVRQDLSGRRHDRASVAVRTLASPARGRIRRLVRGGLQDPHAVLTVVAREDVCSNGIVDLVCQIHGKIPAERVDTHVGHHLVPVLEGTRLDELHGGRILGTLGLPDQVIPLLLPDVRGKVSSQGRRCGRGNWSVRHGRSWDACCWI